MMPEGATADALAHVPGVGLAQSTGLLALGFGYRRTDRAGGRRGSSYDGGGVTSQARKYEHRHDMAGKGSLTLAGTIEEQ